MIWAAVREFIRSWRRNPLLTLFWCTGNIQIDDPTFCYFCDENMICGMQDAGVDHEALLDTYIRAINSCTQGRPEDLRVGVHMCRGNFKVGLPPLSPSLLV